MAEQKGVIKFVGKVGGLSFYNSVYGYQVRQKGGASAERIKTGPEFARTRENMTEFGRAGQGSKLLRNAFKPLLTLCADRQVHSRLTKALMKTIKADAIHGRGERHVAHAGATLLEGFEFNIASPLHGVFHGKFETSIDRAKGTMQVNIGACVPVKDLTSPPGATHVRFVMGAGEVDFETAVVTTAFAQSGDLPVSDPATTPVVLEVVVTAGSGHPLFLVLGVVFGQNVNGEVYNLTAGGSNALMLVKVDVP
jgi:hypothetical protein